MDKTFIMLGSALMFLGVALGAFGAHGLESYLLRENLKETFETAVRYHMFHAIAILVTAFAFDRLPSNLTSWAGWLFFAGVLVFSGSLYLLVATRVRILGAITPIGGVAFLAGWACLFIAAWRG